MSKDTARQTQTSSVAENLNGGFQISAAVSTSSGKILETEIRCYVDSKGNVLPVEVPINPGQQQTSVSPKVIWEAKSTLDESYLRQHSEFYASSSQHCFERKATRRTNNWGGPTYTELLTSAILSAPQQRLTLSQIYSWMAQQNDYFRERKNFNSSQGWKNAIRHTLSVRKRFRRVKRRSGSTGWYNAWWTVDQAFIRKKIEK